ncbi:MAG: hypothetical protein M3163_00455, partial [Actinomycetota bacterium]|nr:hypothetical protein [Actinomycetota bacterium]
MTVGAVRDRTHLPGTVLGAALAAAVVGPLSTRPLVAFLGAAVIAAVTASFLHPPMAAYLILATTPLLAGMDRGAVIPVLRPNEALALLLGGAVLARALSGGRPGRRRRPLRTAEASLLFLIFAGSVVPLVWMVVRRKPVTQLDVFYALVLWKCLAVYLIVRCTIRTERQIRTCLLVAMVAGGIAALVGVLQTLRLFGVPSMIARYFAPEGYASADASFWGTSTVGHAQAMGDVMAFNVGLALAWLAKGLPMRRLVLALIPLFVVGALTTGEFSSAIALVVGAVTVAAFTGTLRRSFLAAVPIVIVAGIIMQPVIRQRLSEFSTPAGIPPSWTGRLTNLQTYVLPELTRDYNYVLGVQPLARVTKSTDPFRYGYIESGHAWFLWTGGIPFLVAFAVFLGTNLRLAARVGRRATGAHSVAATGSLGALTIVAVMTALDPHLTFRGAAELNFSLLALTHLGLGSAAGARGHDEASG